MERLRDRTDDDQEADVTQARRTSRVPLHVTESLETAGSLGGWGPK